MLVGFLKLAANSELSAHVSAQKRLSDSPMSWAGQRPIFPVLSTFLVAWFAGVPAVALPHALPRLPGALEACSSHREIRVMLFFVRPAPAQAMACTAQRPGGGGGVREGDGRRVDKAATFLQFAPCPCRSARRSALRSSAAFRCRGASGPRDSPQEVHGLG